MNSNKNIKILKDVEIPYQLFVENINDLIALTNDNFEYEYVNKEVTKKLMGWSQTDVIGKQIFEFIHPEDLEHTHNLIKTQFQKGEGGGIVRYLHKEGHWEWLEVRAKIFKDAEKNLKILFISRIITNRIEYEKQLEKSEEKYRLITENANDLICKFNTKLEFTYINEETHKNLLGYKKEDVLGEPMWKFIHPKDLQKIYNIIKYGWKKGYASAEYRLKRKDGTYVWLETRGVVFRNRENNLLGVCISRDISKRKEFEELIQEENRRLRKLGMMRDNFINRVSHELKTPMTSIYGSIQLMEKIFKTKLSEKDLEMITIAKNGCQRLKNLIMKVLDVSKIEASKLLLNKENLNFKLIVKNCVEELKYLIDKKHIKITIYSRDNITIFADKLRIEQVIINLLSNALKNTPQHGVISINLNKNEKSVQFCIKDNGIGLEKEEMEDLFTKFGKIERTNYEETIDMEGSGLGLFISKEIIENHKGKIWAESEGRNKGASFFFIVPVK
ncbi:MAG: putative Histidine kinase [Promethearchaeota archaeon]|nr:MAG: putative Histidine kinase [Candidatus Lokiarchaeota archaeon]